MNVAPTTSAATRFFERCWPSKRSHHSWVTPTILAFDPAGHSRAEPTVALAAGRLPVALVALSVAAVSRAHPEAAALRGGLPAGLALALDFGAELVAAFANARGATSIVAAAPARCFCVQSEEVELRGVSPESSAAASRHVAVQEALAPRDWPAVVPAWQVEFHEDVGERAFAPEQQPAHAGAAVRAAAGPGDAQAVLRD